MPSERKWLGRRRVRVVWAVLLIGAMAAAAIVQVTSSGIAPGRCRNHETNATNYPPAFP